MPKAKPAKSYQEMKAELDDVVFALQREDIGVDEALEYYRRGLELLQSIESYLKTAENKVAELKSKFKDTP